ncbi:MAG: 50S ribosomal protein L18 [Phycisphaerales bacterium]|nr:50S ribosomal protein L18 [Phycisphaerales bacterium]
MDKQKQKAVRRTRRRIGIRKRVSGTPMRPRMSVYRSLNHFYVQVIDDLSGNTLASASSRDKGMKIDGNSGASGAAEQVGNVIAERAKAAGITKVVLDRGGYKFHGRVKAFADAARKGGLEF